MENLIELVKATPKDAEILAGIMKRAFDSDAEVGAPNNARPPGYDSVEVHRKRLNDKTLNYLKIFFNGKTVGGVKVMKTYPRQYAIFDVFIDPDYHRRGIGRKSIEMILQRYPDAKRWSLDTPVWNIRTRNFYEGLGFVQYGVMRWEDDPGNELRAYELFTDSQFKSDVIRISDLSDGMKFVIVEGIITADPLPRKSKSKKDGVNRIVADTIITDGSGSVKLVLRDNMLHQVRTGERVRIDAGYVTSFRGEITLNINKYGRIIILPSS